MLTPDDIRAMDADLAEHGTLPEADQRRLIAELSARTQEVASGSGALTSDLRAICGDVRCAVPDGRVYISGPITLGSMRDNMYRALDAADELLEAGWHPFVPHLDVIWHERHPHEHGKWLAYDMAWLPVCEALIRLPGESVGADLEVTDARRLGIPVYDSVAEFLEMHRLAERPESADPREREAEDALRRLVIAARQHRRGLVDATELVGRIYLEASRLGIDHPLAVGGDSCGE